MTSVVTIVWPVNSISNDGGTVAKYVKVLKYTGTPEHYLTETCLRK